MRQVSKMRGTGPTGTGTNGPAASEEGWVGDDRRGPTGAGLARRVLGLPSAARNVATDRGNAAGHSYSSGSETPDF
jgi:hypothetical protein